MTKLVDLLAVLRSLERLDEIAARHPELLHQGVPADDEIERWIAALVQIEGDVVEDSTEDPPNLAITEGTMGPLSGRDS